MSIVEWHLRRSVRAAEGARLESVYARNRIVGSNPTSSEFFYGDC